MKNNEQETGCPQANDVNDVFSLWSSSLQRSSVCWRGMREKIESGAGWEEFLQQFCGGAYSMKSLFSPPSITAPQLLPTYSY